MTGPAYPRPVSAALMVGLAVMAVAAHAVTKTASQSGSASISLIRPLSIVQAAQLNFGRLQPQGNGSPGTATVAAPPPTTRASNGVSLLSGGAETPLIRTISGEPGRAYRITLPAAVISSPGGYAVDTFTIWSANRGIITTTKLGQLDATGKDTIRVGATISLPKGAKQIEPGAAVAIMISYE